MKLMKSTRWVAIAIGMLSGPLLAAPIDCPIKPAYSVITEGQTLQLTALCDGALENIQWHMDGVAVTGTIPLTGHDATKPISFTTPVGLGGTNTFVFKLTGAPVVADPANTFAGSTATVVVEPSSAVMAKANGDSTPMVKDAAACATNSNVVTKTMPSTLCASGSKAALAISGPQSFSWSCISLTGGAEASCYAPRGYTVTATPGANGTVSPASQLVPVGNTASVTAKPDPNYAAVMKGCGGTQSGNTFTTGPVTGDCPVAATFSNLPVNGKCDPTMTVETGTVPSGNLCTVTSTTPTVLTNTASYTWNCSGSNGGKTDSCVAPRTHLVTFTPPDATKGSVSPASKQVIGDTTATFTVTPKNGYSAKMGGNCGGGLSGTTYTTGAIKGPCTASVTFDVAVAPSDPGIGKGLWVPDSMPNRTIADQSSSDMLASYVPGCLNGLFAKDSSSACAANTSFKGTIADTATAHTVTLGGDGKAGSGKQLVLRYKAPASVTDGKFIKVAGWNGGNMNVNMRVWLSDDPLATYASASTNCKGTATTTINIATGTETSVTTSTTFFGKTTVTVKDYCKLVPNATYYLGMEYDEVPTSITNRFQVIESASDFLK